MALGLERLAGQTLQFSIKAKSFDRREEGIVHRNLRQVSDAAFRLERAGFQAEYLARSALRLDEPHERLERAALPCPVGTEKPDDLARSDAKREPANCLR